MCADGEWKVLEASVVNGSAGKDGADGKNGNNGADGKDGTNGQDGKNGKDGKNGIDGKSCTVKSVKNGYKILCGGDSVGIVLNGAKGEDGEPGASIAGPKGEDGQSCTIAEDKGGVVTLQCGEGENSKTAKLYKALCGSEPYDPEIQRCVNEEVLGKCGTGTYKEKTEFCYDGKGYPLCGDELLKYNPNREDCEDGSIVGLCGTKTFDLAAFACVSGTIYPLCGSEPYDPDFQICDVMTGTVTDKPLEQCGSKHYDPETHFCDDREGVNVIYGMITITSKNYSETWMTENLRAKTNKVSVCHPDDNDACTKYGRFYVWDAVMWEDENTSDYVDLCPDGWQLPSRNQFVELANVFGGAERAGKSLKSKEWDGTNESGLNILPAGHVNVKSNGGYEFLSGMTQFWTRDDYNSTVAYTIDVLSGSQPLEDSKVDKAIPALVRCIKQK